ncbi:DUF421 domain-containing protein [Litoribacter ruber]|uniref:DUF421 domain-containing protein n=1 Tax=Litoribacter ruber TaxID=702568 RepID=UPI001BDB024B|nr:YetF domain-containing protein [Litoribacter ruber]MBT0810823.1 DUF421 domain-containing protein [Litoribacter ruber]
MTLLEIGLSDYHRFIFGKVPEAFLLEVVLRTVFVYALLMVSMRLMGKRMTSQLSRLEMASMVALAAAIGVPVLAPEQGLLDALIIAVIVVFSQRLISWTNSKNERFERIVQGDVATIIEDGVLDIKTMEKTLISKERLKAQLRSEKLIHTGQVKRLYFESNGSFSLVEDKDPKPGLLLLPAIDQEFIREVTEEVQIIICSRCASKASTRHDFVCNNCGNTATEKAVIAKSS